VLTNDLLDAVFAAIERGDIDALDALFAEDVEVWHNTTDRTLDKRGSLKLLRYWTNHVRDMRYEIRERRIYDGGAFQRYVIHGTANDAPLRVPVCIVFHIDDGKITRIYEYLDPATVGAVFERDKRSGAPT
jgi:ketosteroid isomerase-like protein